MKRSLLLGAGCAALLTGFVLPASALAQPAPAVAPARPPANVTNARALVDAAQMRMERLRDEINAIPVRPFYCNSNEKAPAARRLEELGARMVALMADYDALKAEVTRLERGITNRSLINHGWDMMDADRWRRADTARNRLRNASDAKSRALRTAPIRNCAPADEPVPESMADPEPAYQPPAPPVLQPVVLTDPPPRFCSSQEKFDFVMNVFFPSAHHANDNAMAAQGHTTDLAQLLTTPLEPDARAAVETALAASRPISAAHARVADVDIPALKARIDATPVEDCNPTTESPAAEPPPAPEPSSDVGSVPSPTPEPTPPSAESPESILDEIEEPVRPPSGPTPPSPPLNEEAVRRGLETAERHEESFTRRLADAEEMRARGDCAGFLRRLEELDEWIDSWVHSRGWVQPDFYRAMRSRLERARAAALEQGCPPAEQTRLDDLSPDLPFGVFHVGTGELDVPGEAGIGFQRTSGGGERFASETERVLRYHTMGVLVYAYFWRQWVLSGGLTYGWGDAASQGRVTEGGGTDAGFVYGGLSPNNSSGVNLGPRGLDWQTRLEAETWNLKFKMTAMGSGPITWFLFADYLRSVRDHEARADGQVSFAGDPGGPYMLRQERNQDVSDDLLGGGVGVQFDTAVGDGGARMGGWLSGGLFHRWTRLDSTERNRCDLLCGPSDADFTLAFDEKDDGFTWSAAAGIYAEFPINDSVSFGVGADAAWIEEVGSVVNPSSGDQVFFDGETTRLETGEALSYSVRLGVRFRF